MLNYFLFFFFIYFFNHFILNMSCLKEKKHVQSLFRKMYNIKKCIYRAKAQTCIFFSFFVMTRLMLLLLLIYQVNRLKTPPYFLILLPKKYKKKKRKRKEKKKPNIFPTTLQIARVRTLNFKQGVKFFIYIKNENSMKVICYMKAKCILDPTYVHFLSYSAQHDQLNVKSTTVK